MLARKSLALAATLIGVAGASACSNASADQTMETVGASWPLSAIEAPSPTLGGRDVAAEDDSTVSEDVRLDANGSVILATPNDGPNGGGYDRPDVASGVGPSARPSVDLGASGPMIQTRAPEWVDFPNARFPRPEHVRGLYVNAWAAGSRSRMSSILDLARRTEVNSLVIDIKDATGFISHRTEVPLAHEIGATEEIRIRDLPALLDLLEAEGIYPIARIVVVKDRILPVARPELAVQDTAGGVWIDSKEIVWLNPFAEGVWEYNVQIGREVAEMGFPEIQWDYIRFPDVPQSDMDRAVFSGGEGKERVDAIRGFLSYARSSYADLPVRSTADVFGVTTSFRGDVGIGQVWEKFIDVVDVALPMVYPSHYWAGSFGYGEPNAYPYEIVRGALRDAVRRSAGVEGAGLTRPWLQDFSLGTPLYGSPEVRAQIQAAYDVGIQEWVLWNSGSRYSESALEPVEGFTSEPLIRVAGGLAPVSRRHIVMDSVAALPPVVDPIPADALAVDSISADALAVDSIPADALAVDSLSAETIRVDAVRVDSIPRDTTSADPSRPDTIPVDTIPVDTIIGATGRDPRAPGTSPSFR